MKKILILGNNDIGLYNFRRELVERLISDGHQVIFSVPYGEKVPFLIESGATYFPIDINRRGKSIAEDFLIYKKYQKLLKSLKPDLVLTYTIKPNIYGGIAASKVGIPCIATITGLGTALQGKGMGTKAIQWLYRYGLRKNRWVFFQNQNNREYFITNKMTKKSNIVVVPGSGVNVNSYQDEKIPHQTINFLFIARLMKEKGIDEFLDAAMEIKIRYPHTVFQVLGFYDELIYQEKIENLVSEGIIEYLGVSNDTREQMAMADCIVLPSYHEGMSNVLLEGAASGLPLIATNISGCKEAIEHGKTGFLCESKSASSLVEAMEIFLALTSEERREMGRLGREKMIREFDRRIVVNRYVECIESVWNEM